MVAREYLDSNRVNFLIWRYLLEGNYRETAVKFQKEWHVAEPHRQFSFAPHVKTQALVQILQRGLLYCALEREHAHRQRPSFDAGIVEVERLIGVFGPLDTQDQARKPGPVESPVVPDEADGEDAPTSDASRKRPAERRLSLLQQQQHQQHQQHQQQSNGSPAKRQRLSNGYETGAGVAATSAAAPAQGSSLSTTALASTAMDIDVPHQIHQTSSSSQGDANNHAYPSPLEGEQASTPIAHTEGPEQGTQVDKVEELATETTFLRLASDDKAESLSPFQLFANDGDDMGGGDISDNAPILLHCEWSPKDPSSLAAAGTDSLARIWSVPHTHASSSSSSSSSSPDHENNHVTSHGGGGSGGSGVPTPKRPFRNLINEGTARNSTVTALAWNWDGSAVALAIDSNSKARISIWDPDGNQIHRFDVQEPPVIKLRWSPDNTALLAISPQDGGTSIIVFCYHTLTARTFSLASHDLNWTPLDAAWISETEFLLCGGDVFLCLRYTAGGIELIRKFETRDDDNFSQILFDRRSMLAATANDRGMLDLWDETGQRRSISAHTGTITALQWQPQQVPPPDNERLIASSGDDCAVLVWNARIPESKARCYMTMDSPVVAIAFTPDGAFIAGATAHQVLIWKVGEHAVPRASWTRAPHSGWLSPKPPVEAEEEEDSYCLCWDSTGQKLAYGVNSRLAIIRFR